MSIRDDSRGTPQSLTDLRYLKRDQTTPQKVINGAPQFDKGLKIKADEWIYLDGV